MRQNDRAKVIALPTVAGIDPTNLAFTPFPDPPKLITPPVQLDSWVGPCDSCGYAVFSGDDYELQEDKPVCPTCISEQSQWKAVEVRKVA